MENCFFTQARRPAPSLRSCSVSSEWKNRPGVGSKRERRSRVRFPPADDELLSSCHNSLLPQTVPPDLSSKNCTKHAAVFYFGEAQVRFRPWSPMLLRI